MSKNFLIPLFICFICIIFSCQKKYDQNEKFYDLKTKNFSTLTNNEKTIVKEGLVSSLKVDTNFIHWQNHIHEMVSSYLTRSQTGSNDISSASQAKDSKSLINYYKERGIKKPEIYVSRMVLARQYMDRIVREFPIIATMDRQSLKEVYMLSSKGIDKSHMDKIKNGLKSR